MNYIKKNYKYLLLFLFFLVSLILFGYNNTDIIWNYGMAHAIRIGEIPYKDFNIITTPLYPFIMSLGLFIKDSYLVYIIEQSLLLVLFYYLVSKLLKEKTGIFLFVLVFPLFYLLFPNYNFLVVFFITLLLYLEKNKSNDYLIGLVLGLLFLTKHTIGGVILVCSLISCFNIKKSLKRIGIFLVVVFVFVIYLLITNSLYDFINLSILGLFDFNKSNNYMNWVFLMICILMFIHLIIRFIKDRKNINNYYLLGSFTLVIPIVDFFHLNYLVLLYLIIIIIELDNKNINNIKKIIIPLIITTIGINIYLNMGVYRNIKFIKYNHFEGYITTKSFEKSIDRVYNKYKDGNNYMFAFPNMFFDISTDHKITYFDVPLYGNFGYNGVSTMKKKIDSMHDIYFFIKSDDNTQYCTEIYYYIKNISKAVEVIDGYEIYYKE